MSLLEPKSPTMEGSKDCNIAKAQDDDLKNSVHECDTGP